MDRLRLPPTFTRLAWSNLAAQSAEQVGLAAAPVVAVVALGAGVGATGLIGFLVQALVIVMSPVLRLVAQPVTAARLPSFEAAPARRTPGEFGRIRKISLDTL